MYILPEVEVFSDANFQGNSWRFNMAPGWGWTYVGDDWNDTISSVIVVSGIWQFFENGGFTPPFSQVGPGWYSYVQDPSFNLDNDSISSMLCVGDDQGDNPYNDFLGGN